MKATNNLFIKEKITMSGETSSPLDKKIGNLSTNPAESLSLCSSIFMAKIFQRLFWQ